MNSAMVRAVRAVAWQSLKTAILLPPRFKPHLGHNIILYTFNTIFTLGKVNTWAPIYDGYCLPHQNTQIHHNPCKVISDTTRRVPYNRLTFYPNREVRKQQHLKDAFNWFLYKPMEHCNIHPVFAHK